MTQEDLQAEAERYAECATNNALITGKSSWGNDEVTVTVEVKQDGTTGFSDTGI